MRSFSLCHTGDRSGLLLLGYWKSIKGYVRLITSASALTESIEATLTLTLSPTLTLRTKTQKPLTAAKPSPFGIISVTSTSYSPPISTGQSALWRLFLAFLGLLFLGLIEILSFLTGVIKVLSRLYVAQELLPSIFCYFRNCKYENVLTWKLQISCR